VRGGSRKDPAATAEGDRRGEFYAPMISSLPTVGYQTLERVVLPSATALGSSAFHPWPDSKLRSAIIARRSLAAAAKPSCSCDAELRRACSGGDFVRMARQLGGSPRNHVRSGNCAMHHRPARHRRMSGGAAGNTPR